MREVGYPILRAIKCTLQINKFNKKTTAIEIILNLTNQVESKQPCKIETIQAIIIEGRMSQLTNDAKVKFNQVTKTHLG